MSLFRSILEKLGIGHNDAPSADVAPSTPPVGGASSPASPAPGAAPAAVSQVDVAQKLDGLTAQHSEPLNWRTSIVDLLKVLSLDSSLGARKELATELGYSGSTDDSAAMNTWLHAQVLKKLAENGGTVPDELLV